MIFKKITLLSLLFIAVNTYAQNIPGYGLDWAIALDDTLKPNCKFDIHNHVQDSEGNIIIAGSAEKLVDMDLSANEALHFPFAGWHVVVLAKYDSLGNYLWSKTIGSMEKTEFGGIAIDSNDNIVTAFFFQYDLIFDSGGSNSIIQGTYSGNAHQTGAAIIKYDPLGDVIWEEHCKTNFAIYPQKIAIDNNNEIIVSGYFFDDINFQNNLIASPTPTYSQNAFFLKLNNQGNYLWGNAFGNMQDEEIISIDTDTSNNIIIATNATGIIDADPSPLVSNVTSNGILLSKFGPSGDFMWAHSYSTSISDLNLQDMIVDDSSNVLLTGHHDDSGAGPDFDFGPGFTTLPVSVFQSGSFVAKYDDQANLEWVSSIDTDISEGRKLTIDSSNVITVAGVKRDGLSSPAELYLSQIDNLNGNILSFQIAEGTEDHDPAGITITPGSNFPVVTGDFDGVTDFDMGPSVNNVGTIAPPNAIYSAFIARYNTSIEIDWADAITSDYNSIANTTYGESEHIAQAPNGTIYLTGDHSGHLDFNPDPTIDSLPAGQFIARYDANGDFLDATLINDLIIDAPIIFDQVGNFYLAGHFSTGDSVDFDLTTGTHYETVSNIAYLAKYDGNLNLLWVESYDTIGPGYSRIFALAIDPNNNPVVLASGNGNIDIDLTANTNITAINYEHFLAKITPSGSPIWTQLLDCTPDTWNKLAINGEGDIFHASEFNGTSDLDPSASNFNVTSTWPYGEISLTKLDSLGQFQWGFALGAIADQNVEPYVEAGDSAVYISGRVENAADFDPSAGINTSNGTGIFVAKYNFYGDLDWYGHFGAGEALGSSGAFSIDLDSAENVLIHGTTYSNWNQTEEEDIFDLDPSPAVNGVLTDPIPGVNSQTGFVSVYDSSGNHLWAIRLDNSPNFGTESSSIFSNDGGILIGSDFRFNVDPVPYAPKDLMFSNDARVPYIAKYSPCNVPPFITTDTACISYTWLNDITYTNSGTYVDTFYTAEGCRFQGTLELTIVDNDTTVIYVNDSTLTVNNAPNTSFQWYDCLLNSNVVGAVDTFYTSSTQGYFSVILDNGFCVDTSSCYFSECNIPDIYDTIVACDSFTWINGTTYTSSGNFIDSTVSTLNCTSYQLLNLTINILDTSIIQQNDTTLTGPPGYSYQWINCMNSMPVSGATNQTFTTSTFGDYALIVTSNGCSATSSCYTLGCAVPDSNEYVTVCSPYTWSNGVTYDSSGIYTQVLETPGGCPYNLNLNLTTFNVNSWVLELDDSTLVAYPPSASYSYQWLDCQTGQLVSGANNIAFTTDIPGLYAAIVSEGACADTSDCVPLHNAGIDDFFIEGQILIYPNPTHETFTVELPSGLHSGNLRILDLSGRVILNKIFNNTNLFESKIEGSPGMYIVEIEINGHHWTERIIKRNY